MQSIDHSGASDDLKGGGESASMGDFGQAFEGGLEGRFENALQILSATRMPQFPSLVKTYQSGCKNLPVKSIRYSYAAISAYLR